MLAFVDQQEIAGFDGTKEGAAFTWEGENVVHLHVARPLHGYGKESLCLFTDDTRVLQTQDGNLAKYDYVVIVGESSVEAFAAQRDSRSASSAATWQKMELEFIPDRENLYSRSKGILEVNVLAPKRVMIVGLGSFGSQIAVELAKAGVGGFSLFDFDRVELHNLMRHTCVVNDLGRLKTDAIRDAILGKNPYAIVDRFPVDINKALTLLEEEVAKADLVICATDNNKSRFNLNAAVVKQKKTCIFGRANTRAAGGDVFRYVPGGPCYNCLLGNAWFSGDAEEITDVESGRRNGQIAAYVSAEDANAVVQVGLSADIAPICNMMVKLTLVELSRGAESGISALEEELVYDYYMWANRRENRFENWSPMPGAGPKPTILRWYGCKMAKLENCAFCGETDEISLDEGEEVERMMRGLFKSDLSAAKNSATADTE